MRGFTLLEMLLVIGLLGVLTAITAAALGPLSNRYRATQATEMVTQSVYQARAWARESNRCHQVEVLQAGAPVAPGTAGNALRIQRRTNADCESAPGVGDLEIVETVNMPNGIPVMIPSGMTVPVWRPNGRLQGPATELLVGTTFPGLIQIQPQGPVCVTSPTAPGTCP